MSETRDTYRLLRAFCDELARCAVAGACTSPGSRSTPLVLSLVREPRIRCFSHVDERAAGFFALGLAKATSRPAVVTCTSGTAAANYLPAVVEAREAGVPLIVLTADRPPELREVGAGQAIDQLKLFGSAAKWFFDVGTHSATPERLRWIRQLACRAVHTALEGRPGPVHLNVALREPLVLDTPLDGDADEGGRPDGRPWTTAEGDGPSDPSALTAWLRGRRRGIVVAGRDDSGALGPAAAALAHRLGWPLLADPLSGARRGDAAIAHYDALLRPGVWLGAPAPECVLRLGDLPTSKPLRQWLAGLAVSQVAVAAPGVWPDPDAVLSERFALSPAALALVDAPLVADPAWLATWRAADARAATAIAATLDGGMSEPGAARTLARAVGAGAHILVAASMPIRDVETFWPVLDPPPRALANRGANGIDGTIATAYGIAAGGSPTYALLGDVTLAHDLGALLAGPRLGLDLTLVVVDNGGGGIFDFLPVSTQTDAYEEHILTPTGLDVARIASLFAARYRRIDDLDALAEELARPPKGTTILHVTTNRTANVALHRRCWDAVGAALADEPDAISGKS